MKLLAPVAGAVILAVWAASAVEGIVRHDWNGLQLVTPVMLILAPALLGFEVVRRTNGKKKSDERDHS